MSQSTSPFQPMQVDRLKAIASPNSALRLEPGRGTLVRIAQHARADLREGVMPFWESRVIDPDHSGLFHYFDRAGQLTDPSKGTWSQGRMAYTFSLLGLELGADHPGSAKWLEAASSARRFLLEHAYAGGGRWHYRCDRAGKVVDAHGSAFSDTFALMGLCARALVTGEEEDHPLIRQALEVLTANLQNPEFDQYHHFEMPPGYRWHGPAMVALGLVPLARAVVGEGPVQPLADWAMDQVLVNFANDEHQMLLEMTTREGGLVDTERGRTTNPGHALEGMWFCLEEALIRGDKPSIARCLQIIRWAFDKGWDRDHGGLFAFIGVDGQKPPGNEEIAFGDRWDDKLWWVQSESLYCLALAAAISDDPFYLESLQKLQRWTFDHLPDREYGEWFMSTTRDGHPKNTDKGNVFRSAFHVPRSLLKLARLGDAVEAV